MNQIKANRGFFRASIIVPFLAGVFVSTSLLTLRRVIFDQSDKKGKETMRQRPVVVCFGDSITEHAAVGWVGHLSHWWSRKVDILNRGFSGYNSRWALIMIQDICDLRPDLVTIFFGANDAVDSSTLQYVPLEEYKRNLKEMVKKIRANSASTSIILITPPPIWEPSLEEFNRGKGKALLRDRTNERTQTYAEACKQVAMEENLPAIDLWQELGATLDSRANFLIDGLHLNEKGNYKVFELIVKVIEKFIPSFTAENLKMHKLHWSQINPKDPRP